MTDLKVEMIKKGDAMFLLDSKIELLEMLLSKDENKEIEYRAENSKVMAEWTNGRVEARKCDLSTLKEIRTYLQSL
jgi:hypothetical protein